MVQAARRKVKRPVPKVDLTLRLWIALALPLIGLGILLFRLWYLQVARGDELEAKATSLRAGTVSLEPPRGLIYDRNGQLVAGIRSAPVVTGVPSTLLADPISLAFVARTTGTPEQVLKERLEEYRWRPYTPIPLVIDVEETIATRIAEALPMLNGVDVELRPTRYYPDTVSLSHILGYVWTPSAEDVKRLDKQGVRAGLTVGKVGIEAFYEKQLMGVAGRERVEVDNKGRPARMVSKDDAQPGLRVNLSVDSGLQSLANKLLAGRTGAIVALEPKTGEVLCLASSPSYDSAKFLHGISRADFAEINDDPQMPLLNRAIGGFYSPGSTFKIATTLAAVEQGIFDPKRTAYCNGYYQVGNRKLKCLGRHGGVAFEQALIKSCNAYFADLGMRAGKDALCKAALELGLGARTGIDLLGERKGVVPTDEWLRAVQKTPAGKRPTWYSGDTVNISIGQGNVNASPLQMAMVISAVANGGVSYKPHLVHSFRGVEGAEQVIEPEVLHRIDADKSLWQLLRNTLVGVIEYGTARSAQIDGVRWAGKTGSTEFRRSDKTHSWFIGFAPADDPKIAIAVLVEQAGHGGEVSAPIAGQLVKRYLQARSKPSAAEILAAAASAQAKSGLPNAL